MLLQSPVKPRILRPVNLLDEIPHISFLALQLQPLRKESFLSLIVHLEPLIYISPYRIQAFSLQIHLGHLKLPGLPPGLPLIIAENPPVPGLVEIQILMEPGKPVDKRLMLQPRRQHGPLLAVGKRLAGFFELVAGLYHRYGALRGDHLIPVSRKLLKGPGRRLELRRRRL